MAKLTSDSRRSVHHTALRKVTIVGGVAIAVLLGWIVFARVPRPGSNPPSPPHHSGSTLRQSSHPQGSLDISAEKQDYDGEAQAAKRRAFYTAHPHATSWAIQAAEAALWPLENELRTEVMQSELATLSTEHLNALKRLIFLQQLAYLLKAHPDSEESTRRSWLIQNWIQSFDNATDPAARHATAWYIDIPTGLDSLSAKDITSTLSAELSNYETKFGPFKETIVTVYLSDYYESLILFSSATQALISEMKASGCPVPTPAHKGFLD